MGYTIEINTKNTILEFVKLLLPIFALILGYLLRWLQDAYRYRKEVRNLRSMIYKELEHILTTVKLRIAEGGTVVVQAAEEIASTPIYDAYLDKLDKLKEDELDAVYSIYREIESTKEQLRSYQDLIVTNRGAVSGKEQIVTRIPEDKEQIVVRIARDLEKEIFDFLQKRKPKGKEALMMAIRRWKMRKMVRMEARIKGDCLSIAFVNASYENITLTRWGTKAHQESLDNIILKPGERHSLSLGEYELGRLGNFKKGFIQDKSRNRWKFSRKYRKSIISLIGQMRESAKSSLSGQQNDVAP